MQNILIVQLSTNILLIGDFHGNYEEFHDLLVEDHVVRVTTPAQITVHRSCKQEGVGFLLMPWVPHEFLQDTRMTLSSKDIVGFMTPSPAIISFYQTWAAAEREKLALLYPDQSTQIKEIEVLYAEHHEAFKRLYTNSQPAITLPLKVSDALYEMFDTEIGWGNPSVTN